MVRFQKLTRNVFLTLRGHNLHRQQRQLSKFLMRYQQFAGSDVLQKRQLPSPLATPFAGSNTMRFLSLGGFVKPLNS